MTTTPTTADLIALQTIFNGRSSSYAHAQSNIAERVKFVLDLLPAYTILNVNLHAGDKLRSIIARALDSDRADLVDLGSQAQIALDGYRARQDQLRSDAYKIYVNDITRFNDNYKYHRRVKQKRILSESEFLSKIPTL